MAKREPKVERPEYSEANYRKAHPFLTVIRKYYLTKLITGKEYKLLREQALGGYVEEARRQLEVVLKNREWEE